MAKQRHDAELGRERAGCWAARHRNTLESHPESPPGDRVPEFLKEEFSGLFN